jgi:hypothetical protein
MELLGLDVGWAESRPSCGVASLSGQTLAVDNVFARQLRVGIGPLADRPNQGGTLPTVP